MKNLFTTLFVLLCLAGSAQPHRLAGFTGFVGSKLNIPKSMLYDCSWNYAIVKATTDKNGQITSWKCLNEVPDSLNSAFKFLIGYQFDPKLNINKHPVVFYVSVANIAVCNKPAQRPYTPNEVVELIFDRFLRQVGEEPNTIFIFEPIIYQLELPDKPGIR